VWNVDGLGDFPRLTELDLRCNGQLEDITDLARCPNLKVLDVSGTSVKDTSFFRSSIAINV
jgi:Leucine-rich repeat (LRR) protein